MSCGQFPKAVSKHRRFRKRVVSNDSFANPFSRMTGCAMCLFGANTCCTVHLLNFFVSFRAESSVGCILTAPLVTFRSCRAPHVECEARCLASVWHPSAPCPEDSGRLGEGRTKLSVQFLKASRASTSEMFSEFLGNHF